MNTTTSLPADPSPPAAAPAPARCDHDGGARWHSFLAKLLLPAMLFAMSMSASCRARPRRRSLPLVSVHKYLTVPHLLFPGHTSKIATDLQQVIVAPSTPSLSWVKDVSGQRYVKALVFSDSTDPDLTALRADVLAKGGAVYYRYISVRGLAVLLPANRVAEIAARSDVRSVSPNRLTARTASTLEYATGTLVSGVRTYSNATTYAGLDGTGVGIAVLDSGVMAEHKNMQDAAGMTRVRRLIQFTKVGDATATGTTDWTPGCRRLGGFCPRQRHHGDLRGQSRQRRRLAPGLVRPRHACRVDRGRSRLLPIARSTGVAPNANLYDVKVLNGKGFGQLSDVLAGIDWVIYHAKEYNIRVMNLSLAADSTETWQTDPWLWPCAAPRRPASPWWWPRAISAKPPMAPCATAPSARPATSPASSRWARPTPRARLRAATTASTYSARVARPAAVTSTFRPCATSTTCSSPTSWRRATRSWPRWPPAGTSGTEWQVPKDYPQLKNGLPGAPDGKTSLGKRTMVLSGTSIASPAVSGTVALMLQANPGLTPPLIKAILQYTAQPLPGANLLEQGAGLLNVEGAVRLAKVLRTDVKTAVEAGTILPGATLLAAGKVMPAKTSTLNNQTFNWSRIVYVGGNQVVSGDTLFTNYQPIYDHRLVWAGNVARRHTVTYWPAATGVPATFRQGHHLGAGAE